MGSRDDQALSLRRRTFVSRALGARGNGPCYADYLNFLVMGEATLTFPQTIVLRYTRLEPPERRAVQAADDYRVWFLSRLRAASTMVGEEFVCAGRFTMADISFAYALLLGETLGLAAEFPASLAPYWQAMQA